MFEDEAGFGLITDTAACWAPPKRRPQVPIQRIRDYRTAYGAVSPIDGEVYYEMMDRNDTDTMGLFLLHLSEKFPDFLILLCMDNAGWHTSKHLDVPSNIQIFFIPPRTPQMNPIELLWREIRKNGLKNKCFHSLFDVIDKFWQIVADMSSASVRSITFWDWIENIPISEEQCF